MTDFARFKALFDSVGCGYDEVQGFFYHKSGDKADESGIGLLFKAKEHAKVGGYIGFETRIDFTKDGKFLGMDCYE